MPRNVGIRVKRIQINSYGKKMYKKSPVGGGRGVVLPYKSHISTCRQRVGFFRLFGLKTGEDFAYLGLESGMVLKGTTRSVGTYLAFQFKMSKEEREVSKLEMDLTNVFVCALI